MLNYPINIKAQLRLFEQKTDQPMDNQVKTFMTLYLTDMNTAYAQGLKDGLAFKQDKKQHGGIPQ